MISIQFYYSRFITKQKCLNILELLNIELKNGFVTWGEVKKYFNKKDLVITYHHPFREGFEMTDGTELRIVNRDLTLAKVKFYSKISFNKK